MASMPVVAEDDEIDFPLSFAQKKSADWSVVAAKGNSRFIGEDRSDLAEAMPTAAGSSASHQSPSQPRDVEAEINAAIAAIKLFQDSLRGSPLRRVGGTMNVLPTIPEAAEYSADGCEGNYEGEPSPYIAPLVIWGSQFRRGSGFSRGMRRVTRSFDALNVLSDQDNCIL